MPNPLLSWIPKSFNVGSYARDARVDYFIVTLERYQAAAAITQHSPTALVAEILGRVPLRSSAPTTSEYQMLVGKSVAWSDCFALEREIISALPDVALAAGLRQQRIRYSQIAPKDEYAGYIKSALDVDTILASAPAVPFDRLRSELAAVTDRIIYFLTASGLKENIRGWLTVWTVVLMGVGMALIFGAYYALWHQAGTKYMPGSFSPTESLFLVLFAGLIGGFVSVQQRLQQPTIVDPLYKRIELEASGFSIVVSPVIGMIFACVLFVIMIAGLLKSVVFPDFTCPIEDVRCNGHDLAFFAAASTPADAASWAKLTLWAFAAGFLERLVPDVLTRLATVATNAKT